MDRSPLSKIAGKLRSQQGSFFLIGAVYLASLLAFASFVIDLGQLYRQQIYTQKAVDAGVLSGIGYSVFSASANNNEGESLKEKIEARAREAILDNLNLGGFQTVDELSVDYDVSTYTLTAVGTSEPTYLFGLFKALLPDKLDAAASAKRRPANIHLILDYSSSMDCPVDGTCNCIKSGGTLSCADEAGGPQNQKITHLKVAVHSFLDHFDPSFDRIGLTLFNTAGSVVVPINNINNVGFDEANIRALVDGYLALGNTNPSDAIYKAYADMDNADIIKNPSHPNEEATYVIFTDGPPTAARFLLGSPRANFQQNPPGSGLYDYTSYAVHWSGGTGPSVLIKSDTLNFGDTDADIPIGATSATPAACAAHTAHPSSSGLFDSVFSDCIRDLGFLMPDGSGVVYGSNCGDSVSFSACYIKQYYHVLIQLTDFLRDNQGVVYVIGLGTEAPVTADPYQGISDNVSMKPVLLAKMANDYYRGVDIATSELGSPYPAFNEYPEYQGYSSLADEARPKVGRFSSSPDAAELKELFDTVAAKILLRLTS